MPFPQEKSTIPFRILLRSCTESTQKRHRISLGFSYGNWFTDLMRVTYTRRKRLASILDEHAGFPIRSETTLWRHMKRLHFCYSQASKVSIPRDSVSFVAQQAAYVRRLDEYETWVHFCTFTMKHGVMLAKRSAQIGSPRKVKVVFIGLSVKESVWRYLRWSMDLVSMRKLSTFSFGTMWVIFQLKSSDCLRKIYGKNIVCKFSASFNELGSFCSMDQHYRRLLVLQARFHATHCNHGGQRYLA